MKCSDNANIIDDYKIINILQELKSMIEIVTYTLAGVLLYLISDSLLQRLELNAGHRFKHRSIIFFFIITLLSVASFSIFRYMIINQ